MLKWNASASDNPYFTLGAAGLAREIERDGKVSPLFVNFSRTNIVALLPTRFKSALGHLRDVVLIADVHLYPLAMCYYQHFSNILGVLKSDTPLSLIVSRLRQLSNGEKMNLSPLAKKAAISYREAVLLEQSLEGISDPLLPQGCENPLQMAQEHRQEIRGAAASPPCDGLRMMPWQVRWREGRPSHLPGPLQNASRKMRRTILAQAPCSLIIILMSSLLFSACHADTGYSSPAKACGGLATADLSAAISRSPLGIQEAKYLTAVNEALQRDADAAAKVYVTMDDVQAAQARQTDDDLFNAQWRMARRATRLAVVAAVKEAAESVRKERHYRIILDGARPLAADAGIDVTQAVTGRLQDKVVKFGPLPEETGGGAVLPQ